MKHKYGVSPPRCDDANHAHVAGRLLAAATVLAPVALVAASALAADAPAASRAVKGHLASLHAVGLHGAGNAEAARAWSQLVQTDAGILLELLAALDEAEPLAANWIGAAVDAIAGRELAEGGKLPLDELEGFVLDTTHSPRARRLAFQWLANGDSTAREWLIPGMLDDPGAEFRREAVARLVEQAGRELGAGQEDAARELYQKALSGAVHEDQVKRITAQLAKLGVEVDLPSHFGFVLHWKLIAPFDNRGGVGFETVYPPETKVDLQATHKGKEGPVAWIDHVTNDDYGVVDLDAALGKHKGAVAYALAEFTADERRPVELRLGCITAAKIWLNGELLFAHEEYHRGMKVDQYRARGELQPGRNHILVKICQNEQTERWAQVWKFQLRVCDATGSAVLSTTRPGRASATAAGSANGTVQ